MTISNTGAKGTIKYSYSADGSKLRTEHIDNNGMSGGNKTTDYVGNRIYEGGSLKRTMIEGGHIEGTTYYFYLTDHLGNNRVVADVRGWIAPGFGSGSTILEIQKNSYYPFGMAFATTTAADQDIQPFKYGNKELDRKFGLNNYDFEARHYDPAYSRFTTVDPLAEKYYSISPYGYCANNPLRFVDPTGMAWRAVKESDKDDAQTIGYEWIPDEESYDKDGNLLSGLYQQAIFFTDNKTFNKKSGKNLGSSTAVVFLADGTTVEFDASTRPSNDDLYATIPEGDYEATVGLHNNNYTALRVHDFGNTQSRIELGMPNPSDTKRTYAQGINIHKAGLDNWTGMTISGNPVSAGCLLICQLPHKSDRI